MELKRKGGPKTEEGKARALANLRQQQQPGHGAYKVEPDDPPVIVSRQAIQAAIEAELGKSLRPADRTVVGLLAVTLRRVELLEAHLDAKGMFKQGGEPRPALEAVHKFLRLAREYCNELGLSPAGRVKLGLHDPKQSPLATELARLAREAEREEVQ